MNFQAQAAPLHHGRGQEVGLTIMKKTYIIPQLHITEVRCETLFAASQFDVDTQNSVSTQYVKGESSSRSNYNVWDDDWSN